MQRIELTELSYDSSDGLSFLDIRASNGRFCAAAEFYSSLEEIRMFSSQLRAFGSSVTDAATLSVDDFRVRAFIYSAVGRAALEIVSSDTSSAPYGASARFFIRTEVAGINRLGDDLAKWIESKDRVLKWETPDA